MVADSSLLIISSCDSNEQTSTMVVTAIIAAKALHDSYLWHSLERMTEM